MSVRIEHRSDRALVGASTLALVVMGIGVLIWRSQLFVLPSRDRAVMLAALYGAVLIGAVLVPAPHEAPRLPRPMVLAIGLGGLLVVSVAAGPPLPLPAGVQMVALALLAAVAEEALFRRAAYAALEPLGTVAAVALTALAFAAMHVPLYGVAAFPVDLGAGLLFGWQRWASGTWTVPAATHAAANLLVVIA